MYLSETIQDKWKPVMEHGDLPEIKDSYRRDVTLRLLENQEKFLSEQPANDSGDMPNTGGVAKWDPILISLVRRAMPQMIAYDVCGVQPMTGPTGLIFAMKSHYTSQAGAEALFDEADTDATGGGLGTHVATDDTNNPFDGTWTTGTGHTTAQGEALGDGGGTNYSQMAFTITKTSVTAKTRALKAEYSTELAQDLKAVHGLDAETELANILSTEILAEINREVIRRIYKNARYGAATDTTTAGVFDLNTDSNGRWMVEKFKGLLYQIERDANAIARTTRRGKGNFMICSSDVASAMAMAGILDYAPAMSTGLDVDDAQRTFAGVLNGKMKVYIDPYWGGTTDQFYTVGYKGSSAYDAGMFYCPYVPLQMVRAMGENSFQPKIGFKTRYGIADNPFVAQGQAGTNTSTGNVYYRKVKVLNLM
jgi:hypothetical protein